jgi:hypothetical protein
MDAMMASDVWNPSQIWYWIKRGLYVNTSRESWFRWSLFCKYPWRKFIRHDYCDQTVPASCRGWTATHTNYARLLLTDKHIFANFTCWDGTGTQLLIDRTIRIRTRFGWSFRADTANKGFPRPMPLVISCMSPKTGRPSVRCELHISILHMSTYYHGRQTNIRIGSCSFNRTLLIVATQYIFVAPAAILTTDPMEKATGKLID